MGGVSGEGIMETDSQSHNQDCTESEIVETKTLGGVIAAASGYENPQSHRESPRRYTNLTTIITSHIIHVRQSLAKFARFVGPGFLIAVAYIDPGNYATDVAAGAEFRYALLFIVLLSNLFAIFLQSLCIKLGSVTGLNLAENCREHLPKWLVYILYFLSEAAIVATDIAEVWPAYSTVLSFPFRALTDLTSRSWVQLLLSTSFLKSRWLLDVPSRSPMFSSFSFSIDPTDPSGGCEFLNTLLWHWSWGW